MGIYLNPGNAGFQSAVNSKIYVDKTKMLEYTNEVLDTEQRYICVSRPRRFGKSVTAEMLVAYYSKQCDSKGMFSQLNISKAQDYKKHLNQYYVLHFDINTFRDRMSVDASLLKEMQREIINEIREEFDFVPENEESLPKALANVNKITGDSFVIIIDEWDALFRENKHDVIIQEEYITLLRGLFKDAASKKYVKLAYLTGILPIKKYGTQSAMNNFDEFTMIQPDMLSEYVGFTEEECKKLYDEYNMDFEEAKRWYDGYIVNEFTHIYNPKSVVDSLRRRKFANYWTRTETYESLKGYISMNFDGLKDNIICMLGGEHCKVNTMTFQNDMVSFKSKDDIMTLLVHLGYLAYDDSEKEVYIPNEEVREEFRVAIEGNGWEAVIRSIEMSEKLLDATWNMNELTVAEGIDKVHMENTSVLQYNDENSLSCVITLAYYYARNEYTLIREMPAGKGYADMIFLPHRNSDKPAMIVELKYNRSAEGAVSQIKEKQYPEALEGYSGAVLLVGINYDKKSKKHQCKIEKILK